MRTFAMGREDLCVVVLDATASSGIDTTATTAFIALRDDLAVDGIALWVVNSREASWKLVVTTMETLGAPIPLRFDSPLVEAVTRFERFGVDTDKLDHNGGTIA